MYLGIPPGLGPRLCDELYQMQCKLAAERRLQQFMTARRTSLGRGGYDWSREGQERRVTRGVTSDLRDNIGRHGGLTGKVVVGQHELVVNAKDPVIKDRVSPD